MPFDDDAAYLALKSRDARFDGRLFVGVTTTRVYCRPICRVRTPRRENCRFFDSAAQAEAQRFRPCLKCRPEIAPGRGFAWSVMDASVTLARQAAQLLDAIDVTTAAESETATLAALAARLGVSDRHLRRIFAAEHGVTPVQYLQTHRLLHAKALLTDSALPVSQVALASGFRSLRRFNAALAEHYRLSPTALRRAGREAPASKANEAVELTLGFRPPLDVTSLLKFFAQRAVPGIEAVDRDAHCIRRSIVRGEVAGWVEASFDEPRARVHLRIAAPLAAASGDIARAARHWLDLDAAPDVIDAALTSLPPAEPGIRLPGTLDAFEMAVRAVLGQRVTVAGARTLATRLVDRFGEAVETPWPDTVHRRFPTPQRLARARAESIGTLGILRAQVGAIQALARAWPQLAALAERSPPEALVEHIAALPGFGPWTAQYLVMRWLGWPDAFPPGDVAVLKALSLPKGKTSEREAEARSQAWRPWRSYAVLRLWSSLETA